MKKGVPRIKYEKPLICPYCSENFRYVWNYKKHLEQEHKGEGEEKKGWLIDYKK
mgnify:CR=1 FL=1